MRVILKIDVPYGVIPLAGVSALTRMETLLRSSVPGEPTFQRESTSAMSSEAESLWVFGLFPFLRSSELVRFLEFAASHETAVWHPGGDPRHGLLYVRELADAFGPTVSLRQALASFHSPPHRFDGRGDAALCLDSPESLATCQTHAFERNAAKFLAEGVLITSPPHTWIESGVEIAPGVVLGPNVYLAGSTRLAAGAEIQMGSVLRDVTVAEGALIKPYSVLCESVVGPGAWVGPFAHIRPGTVLEEKVRVGNFVETKKVHMAAESKASHLAYLGDARIGRESNIGAGTITCNYDGYHKHQTVIGERVFIGSDSQLVAPLNLGDDSFVAAGSTITRDVPAGGLAISRGRQVVKEGAAEKIRQRSRRKKKRDIKES